MTGHQITIIVLAESIGLILAWYFVGPAAVLLTPLLFILAVGLMARAIDGRWPY